jgi:hypothetical protein
MMRDILFAAILGLLPWSAHGELPHGGGGRAPGLTFLTLEAGIIGQSTPMTGYTPFPMGGYGTYTGTAPTSATARWTGCGGGPAANVKITTDIYGAGTYLVLVDVPGATGSGCTLTLTTNLGTTATSPGTIVTDWSTGSEVVSNIHNAPGWQASHVYTPANGPKTRVVNGAGWTPGTSSWWTPGNYNPGQPLKAYELTSGRCTSAASGGPSGTGASIGDGTCSWKYLSGVDYISASAYTLDAPAWASGTSYMFGQAVTATNATGLLQSFGLIGTGAHPGFAFCTSTVSPPLGSWSSNVITTSDGCTWLYQGDIVYSSQASYIPWKTYANNGIASVTHTTRDYRALLWNDQEYVAGLNGETNPIASNGHTRGSGWNEGNQNDCVTGRCHYITFTTAPGESFRDSLTPSSPLTGYDPTKGVAFRNPNKCGGGSCGEPAAFSVGDHWVRVDGLQFQSAYGSGVFAWNNEQITNNIIDGGWDNGYTYGAAVWMDVFSVLANNLIISHGPIGFAFKYGNTFVLYNTFVNVGSVSNAAAVVFNWAWIMQPPVISNNAIYGFPHLGAYTPGEIPVQVFDSSSSHNITDTRSGDSGAAPWVQGKPKSATVIIIPGTTYSTAGVGMFVSPGKDWRPGTALISAGVAYGNFNWNCQSMPALGCPIVLNFDTPDILHTSRPQAGCRTVGPMQHPSCVER